MPGRDAEDRFIQAVHDFRAADDRARANPFGGVDTRAFEMVIIDLDAAIPGLTGRRLGHAYAFKANCYYWLRMAELAEEAKRSPLFDVEAARANPTRKAGLAAAKQARELLVKDPEEKKNLAWVDSLIERMQ